MRCILPCPRCRVNYNKHIEYLGPITKKNAERWVYDLHNRVSASSGAARAPAPEFREVVAQARKAPSWHPRNSLIFLESIVESHPGGRAITESEIDCLFNFWHIISGKSAVTLPVKSRTAMRKFLIDLKNKWGISSKLIGLKRACHSDVCVI